MAERLCTTPRSVFTGLIFLSLLSNKKTVRRLFFYNLFLLLFLSFLFILFYSLLNAKTGSFLAAIRDGKIPAIKVSPTLNTINKYPYHGKTAVND